MKSKIIFGLCSIALVVACAKPPVYKAGKSDAESAPQPGPDGVGPNDPVPPDPKPYLGLTCGNVETHRGLRNWRRLSQWELINTVKTVFAIPANTDLSQIRNDIPDSVPFDTVAAPETNMDIARLKGYVRFAESVSAAIDLSKVFPCLPEKEACVSKQVAAVASDAWRRPALQDEVNNLVTLYKQMSDDGLTGEAAFRGLLQAIILSPSFLYRTELGTNMGNDEFELTSWEIASALSYSITRHPPDAKLKELAAKNGLRDVNTILAQANRLFADPKARDGMRDFASLWLNTGHILGAEKSDMTLNSDQAKAAMKAEMENFFIHTMFDAQEKTWNHLFTSDYTIADKSLSGLYGAMPGADGKLKFADANRRGLLGMGGFLAAYTFGEDPNPVTRGVFISERILCTDFSQPPAVTMPQPNPNQTTRERFAQHSQDMLCASCHKFIDGLGFALDNFGSNANFRTMDGMAAIMLNSQVEIDGSMKSLTQPTDLGKEIGASKDGKSCFAKQVFRYTFGRVENAKHKVLGRVPEWKETEQTKLDQCQINAAVAKMDAAGGDLKSAFLAYLGSPAFRLRIPGKDEQPKAEGMMLTTGRGLSGH